MIKYLLGLIGIKPAPVYRVKIVHFHKKYYEVKVKLPNNFFWETVYNALYNTVEGEIWDPKLVTVHQSEIFIKEHIATAEAYNNYVDMQWKKYLYYRKKYKAYLKDQAPFESKDII